MCGKYCPDDPSHHVLPKSLFPHLKDNPDVMVLVCLQCHAKHENAFERIPLGALPECVLTLAEQEGPRAVAYIERTYPDMTRLERY